MSLTLTAEPAVIDGARSYAEHSGMTLKLVSHGGVPSSEPQTVTASAPVLMP